ncbi:HupE/UreJ family protein [Aurantiacibacter flavus]|uniref:HupE/UreJ family protein n=1 Tax=Aurantiacibacter flavus TaxID=3145232 RepID=A0ABV0CZJ1_9SPHN
MRGWLFIWLAVVFAVAPQAVRADDNRPLSLKIEQQDAANFTVTWKLPVNVEPRHMPRVSTDGCEERGRARTWSDPLGYWREEAWHCAQGIEAREIAIVYPLANPNLATIVRVFRAGAGDPQTILLQPQDGSFAIGTEEEASSGGGFLEFIKLGVEHIWIGIDHLLFVAGLVLIAAKPRRILVTITGFTLAHSVTLALAALDLVRLPIAAIEAVIALSIVFLAVEIVKGPRDTLTWRKPVVVASAFGLLHGFGFAAVLREIGLPQGSLVSSLLAFNIGIEIGQVVFAAGIFALLWLLGRTGERLAGQLPVQKLAGYAVGCLASMWMIERLSGI